MNSLTKIFNNIYKYHIMIITKNSKNWRGWGGGGGLPWPKANLNPNNKCLLIINIIIKFYI